MVFLENNKICPNCGTNNKSDSNFCKSCGKQFIQNGSVVDEKDNIHIQNNINNAYVKDSEGNKLGIISLVLYFIGTALISLISQHLPSTVRDDFSSLAGLCPLSGIIVMIIGRIKYPTNKFLKIVMWIIIGSIIFGLIAFIIFVIWCYVTCSNMDTSGCD